VCICIPKIKFLGCKFLALKSQTGQRDKQLQRDVNGKNITLVGTTRYRPRWDGTIAGLLFHSWPIVPQDQIHLWNSPSGSNFNMCLPMGTLYVSQIDDHTQRVIH